MIGWCVSCEQSTVDKCMAVKKHTVAEPCDPRDVETCVTSRCAPYDVRMFDVLLANACMQTRDYRRTNYILEYFFFFSTYCRLLSKNLLCVLLTCDNDDYQE